MKLYGFISMLVAETENVWPFAKKYTTSL